MLPPQPDLCVSPLLDDLDRRLHEREQAGRPLTASHHTETKEAHHATTRL